MYIKKDTNKKDINKKVVKKYFRIMSLILIVGILFVVIYTTMRMGIDKLIKQAYTYFAVSPTLLTKWLPTIKECEHTYGMMTFFGIHTYVFRVLETIGLDFLVPNIYNYSFNFILKAENFLDVGYGVANAFVTPIYYFYIDGGYPFVCLASILFGFVVSRVFNKIKNNIDLKNFIYYVLIMYGVFLTFIRIQTAIPSYILAFIFANLIFVEINFTKLIKEFKSKFENRIKIVESKFTKLKEKKSE